MTRKWENNMSKLKIYEVSITETCGEIIEVKAHSRAEAETKAEDIVNELGVENPNHREIYVDVLNLKK